MLKILKATLLQGLKAEVNIQLKKKLEFCRQYRHSIFRLGKVPG